MLMERYDAIIIGTGQAGPPLAQRLSAAGWKVAIVERAKFGGTCVNTGCIPTKALVASAHVAWLARRAAEYGIDLRGAVGVDVAALMARKDRISGSSATGVEKWVRGLAGATVVQGHARFESATQVRVGDHELHAERIFINVGGRAQRPALDGLDRVPVLTNSSILQLRALPEHLVVVGGSYVGLEFAQMFRRFGSRVTVLQRGAQLVPREDADVAAALQTILEQEGIAVQLGTECIALSRAGERIAVQARCGPDAPVTHGSHVLVATGRQPNTDDLGLDRAGVRVDARGYIEVDDELRTSVPGIWALGDCNGRGAFTHTSYNDFEIVAANLLDGDTRRVSDRIPAYALFTDPPLARIGLSIGEARRRGGSVLVGERAMSRVGRAVEKGEEQGFLRILVDAASERLIGATLLGVEADEAVHALLTLMYAGVSYKVMQRAMHIHPTVSELLPTVLGELHALDPPS
ncbi:MAG TPA: FAD-containing oxidoreductase [Burkholderiaceae bacterium]|nr:FAD-containing oxidoreductase [Burkholderiaceae bacterium]